MKRHYLTGIAAAAMVLGEMAPAAFGDVMKVSIHNSGPKRQWTCKKCGSKFRPHISRSICDECVRARGGGRG